MKTKSSTKPRLYATDHVARNVFRCMLEDFRVFHGKTFAAEAETAFNSSVKDFREYEWPTLGLLSPSRYKAWWQLRNLMKKHRFEHDVYTDDELETKTCNSYVQFQSSKAVPCQRTAIQHAVLQEARKISRSILGNFDESELASHVRFGKRASIGCPYHKAYIDYKLSDPSAFTCSDVLREWFFNEYLPSDPALKRIVKRVFKNAKAAKKPLSLDINYLKLVTVPKSWKTLRAITPLTLIGLFYSYGIGGMVTDRLRKAGLNIDKLQARHKKLAQRYSRTRSHVTADLSKASDSIYSYVLNAVMPRKWYTSLRKTFIRNVDVQGAMVYTESILPMGNGATFPVETLVFYCLIKAVGNLLKVKGTYSVYGDDLIYPRKIHTYVVQVFEQLGIKINDDKTFVDSYFRESCGGDYYRGVDVRPAILPTNVVELSKTKYVAYLYKVYNAIQRRWDLLELPRVFRWLEVEISCVNRKVHQVPCTWPDTAGVKTAVFRRDWHIPWEIPKYVFKHGSVSVAFSYLGASSKKRYVERQEAYYWSELASSSSKPSPVWRWWDTWISQIQDKPCQFDIERKADPDGLQLRYLAVDKAVLVKKEKWLYFTAMKDSIRYRDQTGLVVDWTQEG